MKGIKSLLILTVIGLLMIPDLGWAGKSKVEYDLDLFGLYESNIYHSYLNTDEQGSMLNVVKGDLSWKNKVSSKFRYKLTGYLDLDLYPSYSNRNRSSIGVKLVPTYKYNKKGHLRFKADLSRRNKDLTDDNGQTLTRTLEKWGQELTLAHRYKFNKFVIKQEIGFENFNYDEIIGLRSYDYHNWFFELENEYQITPAIEISLKFTGTKRYYEERKTYSIASGATSSSAFEIRELDEMSTEFGFNYEFIENQELAFEIDYTKRDENFENFYGYKYMQYRLSFDLSFNDRNRTKIIFRFKDKEYENYWTSRIGRLNTVAIDYAEFQIEHNYQLTPVISVQLFIENYNKVSNDPVFDYHDLTTGLGFRFNY